MYENRHARLARERREARLTEVMERAMLILAGLTLIAALVGLAIIQPDSTELQQALLLEEI